MTISEKDYSVHTNTPVPAELWSKVDKNLLYPPFRKKIEELLQILETNKTRFYVICGVRTYIEQDALYAQGRTTDGKVVTRAKAGTSYHNFGIAVDLCKDANIEKGGLQPDWDIFKYEALARAAESIGLEAGLHFQKLADGPHVQFNISKNKVTLKRLDALYRLGGMKDVFRLLDGYDW